jgi:hypothetical protein
VRVCLRCGTSCTNFTGGCESADSPVWFNFVSCRSSHLAPTLIRWQQSRVSLTHARAGSKRWQHVHYCRNKKKNCGTVHAKWPITLPLIVAQAFPELTTHLRFLAVAKLVLNKSCPHLFDLTRKTREWLLRLSSSHLVNERIFWKIFSAIRITKIPPRH